jgi:hypothetical protein
VQHRLHQPVAVAIEVRAHFPKILHGVTVAAEEDVLDLGLVRQQRLARGLARLVEQLRPTAIGCQLSAVG